MFPVTQSLLEHNLVLLKYFVELPDLNYSTLAKAISNTYYIYNSSCLRLTQRFVNEIVSECFLYAQGYPQASVGTQQYYLEILSKMPSTDSQ